MDNLHAQITEELHKIVAMIEQLTGLRSNWNGELILVPPNAPYKGMKPFACAIHLRADLATSDLRWRTLIHEAFHAVSAGYTAAAFAEHIGWEEGTVEQLQRLYRDAIMDNLNVAADRRRLADEDAIHAFNRYIEALERIRQVVGTSDIAFYKMLIETPIRSRYLSLVRLAMDAPEAERRTRLGVLSASQAILKESLHEQL